MREPAPACPARAKRYGVAMTEASRCNAQAYGIGRGFPTPRTPLTVRFFSYGVDEGKASAEGLAEGRDARAAMSLTTGDRIRIRRHEIAACRPDPEWCSKNSGPIEDLVEVAEPGDEQERHGNGGEEKGNLRSHPQEAGPENPEQNAE